MSGGSAPLLWLPIPSGNIKIGFSVKGPSISGFMTGLLSGIHLEKKQLLVIKHVGVCFEVKVVGLK